MVFEQGNLGWALMQKENYIEAEDAYRRALAISSDNNKMCNLGICLMKQGRVGEAKKILMQVKPAVTDGPRGMDSHLKAYERAQQMLKDLESEALRRIMLNQAEQSKLFNAFLCSSAVWQPQPCKSDHFADENVDSNRMANKMIPPQVKPQAFNVDAPPFYSSKNSIPTNQCNDNLKRTRELVKPLMEKERPEPKARRLLSFKEEAENEMKDSLPDSKDFENAIIAAVLGDEEIAKNPVIFPQRKTQKRLKVFEDITHSLSPRSLLTLN